VDVTSLRISTKEQSHYTAWTERGTSFPARDGSIKRFPLKIKSLKDFEAFMAFVAENNIVKIEKA